jgi:hypothetical protein
VSSRKPKKNMKYPTSRRNHVRTVLAFCAACERATGRPGRVTGRVGGMLACRFARLRPLAAGGGRVRSVRGSGHAREVSRGVRCVACSVHLKHGLRRERSFGEHVEIVARLQSRAEPRHRHRHRHRRASAPPTTRSRCSARASSCRANRRGPPRPLQNSPLEYSSTLPSARPALCRTRHLSTLVPSLPPAPPSAVLATATAERRARHVRMRRCPPVAPQ